MIIGTPSRIDDESRAHVVGDPENDLADRLGAARRKRAQEVQEAEQLTGEGTVGTLPGLPLATEHLGVGVVEATEVPTHPVRP